MPKGSKKEVKKFNNKTLWDAPARLPDGVEYVDVKDIPKDRRGVNSTFTWDGAVRMVNLCKNKGWATRFTKPIEKNGMWIGYYESNIKLR